MATRITDNSDIVDYGYLSDYDIMTLSTERMLAETPPWATLHELAWTEILLRLDQRPDSIAEADLSDTTELTKASCLYVCYLACKRGRSDRHSQMAIEFNRAWEKEIESVKLTTSDGEQTAGAYRFRRLVRA